MKQRFVATEQSKDSRADISEAGAAAKRSISHIKLLTGSISYSDWEGTAINGNCEITVRIDTGRLRDSITICACAEPIVRNSDRSATIISQLERLNPQIACRRRRIETQTGPWTVTLGKIKADGDTTKLFAIMVAS